jgi:hypothetical protein
MLVIKEILAVPWNGKTEKKTDLFYVVYHIVIVIERSATRSGCHPFHKTGFTLVMAEEYWNRPGKMMRTTGEES